MRKFLSVLLAVMMVLSTVSFAAPSAFKPIDAVVETPVAEVPADDAELAIGYTDNAPYGDLVFELDFDNLENGTTIANNAMLKELGATLNPDYPKTDELFLVLSQYGSAVVENGVLKAVKTGTGRWPQIQVSVQNKNSFVDSGVIYMEADMMVDLADTQTASVNLGLTGYREYLDGERDAGSSMQASVKTLYNVEDEKWYTLNGHYALNDEDEALGLQCLIMLPTYSASSSETDYFYVDSIRLYYKPFEANVTVNAGGKTGTAKVSTGYPVKLDDLYSAVGASPLYTASGVYVGEEYYTAEDTFYIVEDTEVELELAPVDSQYYTGEYGLQLFNFTFEEETVGAQITDDANTTPAKLIEAYQTPFTDKLFTHPAENWVVMANTGKTFVKADPTNPENTVLATEDITSSGYPVIRVDTWVDYMKKHKWGFVESEEGIFTAVYDVWNKSGDLNFTERFGGLSANVIDADGYYKEKEEVGTETETKVAEQWRTNVTTFSPSNIITNETLSSTTEVSYLKIHAVMPNADTYYMDNIRLYWKPLKADVGFDTNGFDVHITNTTVADVDTTGVLVSDLLDAAGVEYDAARYVFKGLSLDPEGRTGVYTANQKMPLPADCILYFVMEEVELEDNPWYDENGIVLFEIDFDNAEAASVFTATTNNKDHWLKDFAKVNPNIAGSDKWALSTSGMDVVGIENGALKLQWDGSGKASGSYR